MLKKPPKRKKKSNVAKWVGFSENERKAIYIRDNYCCIFSKSISFLGVAHVFMPRSKGGAGNRLNGVLLAQWVHEILDNESHPRHEEIKTYCENYLIVEYGTIDIEKLIYKKWNHI